jgi:hypothetical protein
MIVELKNFVCSKIFKEGGKTTLTELISNVCCSRSATLFVLAIHGGNVTDEITIPKGCKLGLVDYYTTDYNCKNPECSQLGLVDYYTTDYNCKNPECPKFVPAAWTGHCRNIQFPENHPPEVSGIFEVKRMDRPGKLPVIHLNETSKPVDGAWIDLQDGASHNSSGYSITESDNKLVFESTVYSGGGAHTNNRLVGFVPFGTKIRHFIDTYKRRRGTEVKYLEVTPEGLKEIQVALADGLSLEDVLNSPEE